MIIADENIDFRIIESLRKASIEVSHIKEFAPGVDDEKVIEIAKNPPRIILTEDKDFGEWVYAHDQRDISVILLRYHVDEIDTITSQLILLIKSKGVDLFGKFSTVMARKIRIRSLK